MVAFLLLSHYIPICITLLPMPATRPAHPILFHVIFLIITGEDYKLPPPLSCHFISHLPSVQIFSLAPCSRSVRPSNNIRVFRLAKTAREAIHVVPRTDASWQMYWRLQLKYRHLPLSLVVKLSAREHQRFSCSDRHVSVLHAKHTLETSWLGMLACSLRPSRRSILAISKLTKKTKLHGLSPRANYTDRATDACRRSDCQLLRTKGATWSA
jgi:hypothetical protein